MKNPKKLCAFQSGKQAGSCRFKLSLIRTVPINIQAARIMLFRMKLYFLIFLSNVSKAIAIRGLTITKMFVSLVSTNKRVQVENTHIIETSVFISISYPFSRYLFWYFSINSLYFGSFISSSTSQYNE